MSMNETPVAELKRIVIAGNVNSGKSSLFNNLFERQVSITSPVSGTTTDPVTRRIELKDYGACAVTDTAGLDDFSELGRKRVLKTMEQVELSDGVVFVTSGRLPVSDSERNFKDVLEKKGIPYFGVITFSSEPPYNEKVQFFNDVPYVAVDNLKGGETAASVILEIEKLVSTSVPELTPVEGLVKSGDLVLLVTPIDKSAPKGRLILPQVETLRDLLDRNCAAVVVKETELGAVYENLGRKPDLVITDSQAFSQVAGILPPEQKLTSFSILFARKKGIPGYFMKSLTALSSLKAGAKVYVLEACSHHRLEDDIGTVKIPALYRKEINPDVHFSYGRDIPHDIQDVDLVIHCGACMVSRKLVEKRIRVFEAEGIPVINYGLFLAWANGLLPRAIQPVPELLREFPYSNMSL